MGARISFLFSLISIQKIAIYWTSCLLSNSKFICYFTVCIILFNEDKESLNRVALVGSQAQRIAVIRVLNREFTQPLKVEELTKEAGMSSSSFYYHFK